MSEQKCWSCRQYEAVWIHHHEDEEPCVPLCHLSCRNCDAGCCTPECERDYSEDEEYQYAEMVYQEMRAKQPAVLTIFSFGWWKRETEGLLGRKMDPNEAQMFWDLITKRRSHA